MPKYVVILGNMAKVVGPFPTAQHAKTWAELNEFRFRQYSVTVVELEKTYGTQVEEPLQQWERSNHDRHVDLTLGCRLCEAEAGYQRDRLTDPYAEEVPA